MNTKTKKLAAILMATALTVAMVVPAFAATDPVDHTEGDAITEMLFDKIVDTDANTFQPNQTFSFTVEVEQPTSGETAGDDAIAVSAGKPGAVTVNTIATTPNTKGPKTYTGNEGGKFTFDASKFTQPGIYKYKVTETADTTNPDMKYAEPQYLYVYVRRGSNGCEVYGASLVDTTAGVTNKKTGAFTNTYKTNGNTEEVFKDLTIEKTITGTQADTSKIFNFKLTVNSINNNRTKYMVTLADGTVAELTAGTAYDFTLGNGQSIKVENLSSSDTYTIVETEADQDGYKTTYSNNNGETTVATNRKMAADKDITETVTNTRNSVTPTGIFMSYAPYIAMIAAAAVLAFVFLRKREEI